MKKFYLFALAAMAGATAMAQTIELPLTSESYHHKYYESDADWYVTLKVDDYEFYFDIYGAPSEGLVSGQVYTLADMDQEYSSGQTHHMSGRGNR